MLSVFNLSSSTNIHDTLSRAMSTLVFAYQTYRYAINMEEIYVKVMFCYTECLNDHRNV